LEIKINELEIKITENLNYLRYFDPQVILPEKTAEFFLLNYNHLIKIKDKDSQIILLPSISGKWEELEKIEPHLEDLTKRASYILNKIISDSIKLFYSHILDVIKQVSTMRGSEEEIETKAKLLFLERIFRQPEVFLGLFTNVSLPFIQLLQISSVGYASKFILDKAKRLVEAYGLSPEANSFKFMDEMTLTLYRSGVIFPIFFSRVCTNSTTPHYDFILSNMPVREDKCRICERTAITFGLYLLTEPYSSFKAQQKDLCYVVSSYLSNKSAGVLECYPEVIIKKDSKEEQIDIFIRNLMTSGLTIAECKVKENPRATYNTKVNMIRQDLKQLIRKMDLIKPNFGYLITNIQFEDEDERRRILEDAIKSLNSNSSKNIKLLGKIRGKEATLEWDSILSDMRAK